LVERFGRIEEARGSIPLTSTNSSCVRHLLSMATQKWQILVTLMVLCLLLVSCESQKSNQKFEGLEIDLPSGMPELELTDTNGIAFNLRADTKGMVRLVYFGFTECPDICPIHLAQLRDVLELPQSPENVVVIFITVDPERDTPQVLRSYLDQFNSEFVGLSGSKVDLEAAQLAFGALVATPQYPIEGKYTYGHDGRVLRLPPTIWDIPNIRTRLVKRVGLTIYRY
jgi:cytochrome oxidase Cu insertion factor (SCO1/SenC/PrrC family)